MLQVYGSTETCPIAVYTRPAGDWRRPGSTGLPGLVCEAHIVDAAGCEAAIGEPGEVVVRGPNVFFEYWGNAKATAEALRDGWYHTGDIGTRDADGHFYIHDRKNNVIISGGENIYPAEVNACSPGIRRSPKLQSLAGRTQDGRKCRSPASCGARKRSPKEIESFCLEQLARYKVPREYVFLDCFPRNAMGKVQHFRLRERIADRSID